MSDPVTYHKGNQLFNPFPGLRPFSIEESHLFFGREGQSEEVLQLLADNRFVAVIGASGSGKSSLMYCGLVPILYGGFIASAGSNWRIITTRPGNDPIKNLAKSIVKNEMSDSSDDEDIRINITSSIIQRSSLGLVDAISQMQRGDDENILLMVDQFEELFRFKKSRSDSSSINESEAFVKLLVEAIEQTELPIFIILTMRSDFIGECSQFQELTQLINNSNYLIPQMTREDFRKAILGPVAVGGATIEPYLVQQLLNDVGDNPDQLPILQHALMRTWDYWMQQGDYNRPLMMTDYEAVGTMEKALSEHANEAYDELSEKGKLICEVLFKTLSEKGSDNRGIRHPSKVSTVSKIARVEELEVIDVADKFRAAGRSFVTPAAEIPLSNDSVIDLSHESLMRIWNKLKIWVEEEAQAVQMYTRLAEAAELYQLGKTSLWRPPDLQLALNWREKQKPTLEWAQRYHPAFERAMVYLDTSEKEFIAEEENKIRLQRRRLKIARIFSIVLGSLAIVALAMMLYANQQKAKAVESNRREAEQREKAEEQTKIAEQQKIEADKQREIAVEQSKEAEKQRKNAESNLKLAKEKEREAVDNLELAKTNEIKANRNAEEAQDFAEKAQRNAEEAKKNAEEAYTRRMLSIAQSMAVKSVQIENDKNLQGLIAFQAYLFNEQFKGLKHHPDIYQGLYSALKSLKSPTYNVYQGHSDAVQATAFSPTQSSIFYSAGSDGKLLKWDITDKENSYTAIVENNRANRVLAISADGKTLALGTDGLGIQIINLQNNKITDTLSGHMNKIRALTFLPDNQTLISAGVDNTLLVWNLKTKKNTSISTGDSRVLCLASNKAGTIVAGGTKDGKIILWNVKNNFSPTTHYEEKDNSIFAIAINNKGDLIAAGDLKGDIKIWNLNDKKLLVNLTDHNARINDIEFSINDQYIGSASMDGTVRLWDAINLNSQPVVLSDNEGFIFTVSFSLNNDYFVSGSTEEDRLIVRPTTTNTLAIEYCKLLDRNLSNEEWNTYVGEDITYEKTCKEY